MDLASGRPEKVCREEKSVREEGVKRRRMRVQSKWAPRLSGVESKSVCTCTKNSGGAAVARVRAKAGQ
jgi:hypothetical protein